MIKQFLIVILAVLAFAGCNGKKPVPASRLIQKAGKFSYVTPDGWSRRKITGLDAVVVSKEPDNGISPNIFVEGHPRSGNVVNQADKMAEVNRDEIRAYTVIQRQEFATESGLKGLKITAQREMQDGLKVALYHYLLQDGDRVIIITCSCAEFVKQKYEPVFDAALRTLESEK